jgi:hypothetical protein
MMGGYTLFYLAAAGSWESVAPLPSKLTASQADVHVIQRKIREGDKEKG